MRVPLQSFVGGRLARRRFGGAGGRRGSAGGWPVVLSAGGRPVVFSGGCGCAPRSGRAVGPRLCLASPGRGVAAS
eukprot:5877245-Amphidinium_carterae.1